MGANKAIFTSSQKKRKTQTSLVHAQSSQAAPGRSWGFGTARGRLGGLYNT